jgi:hypothetical protein
MNLATIVDFILAMIVALIGFYVGQDKMRASPRLALILDKIDNGAIRFANWRASADIREEVLFIAKRGDTALAALAIAGLIAIAFRWYSLHVALAVCAALVMLVSGSLNITFHHSEFVRSLARFFGICAFGIVAFGLLASMSLIDPLSQRGFDWLTGGDGIMETIGTLLLLAGSVAVVAYMIFTAGGFLLGYGIFATLAFSRRAGIWSSNVTKSKLLAWLVAFAFIFGVLRAVLVLLK